jgi:hypothetical protein
VATSLSTAEALLAGFVLAACVAGLARLVMPAPWRARAADTWLRVWRGGRGAWQRAGASRAARREADELIHRARRRPGGTWDGNVFRPDGFDARPDRDPPAAGGGTPQARESDGSRGG